jgi:predicted flap endonuclease-1-like 5' DNA nuclease/cell division protein FtsB
MPEIALMEIAVLAGVLLLGIILGWIFRSGRCAKEKIAVNAGWQEQLESQRSEHDRLAGQNQSLMEQISQYQASMKDSNMRAKELSGSLKETFERRDQLQVQLKEIRGELEVVTAQREKFKAEAKNRDSRDETSLMAIRDRDNKIFRLSRELNTWQSRVPPLVEKFRDRDQEALELEAELQQARERIAALEAAIGPDNTRIEPVDPNSLADGLNASNDPLDGASGEFETELVDQNSSYNKSMTADELDLPDTDLDDDEQTVEADALVNDSEVGGDDSDDLKQIKGVGPAIEKTLNDLGIYRFNQIAEMSENDIDRVAQRMKGFRSRIYREDWVGQARSLQYQKNNDPA